MEPITEAELRQLAPGARRDYIEALVNGWSELDRADINTPARLSEFLGQVAHETGGFTIVRENTCWTPAQMCRLWPSRFKTKLDPRIISCGRDPQKLANLAYSGRAELGNRGGDDGWQYRGGSFLQTTGRDNYRRMAAVTGIPLEEQPELIERAEIGLRCAIQEWKRLGCNRFADRGYTRAIGNAINRGNPYSGKEPIGAESRKQWRDRALAVFGDGAQVFAEGLALGAYGSEVEVLQRRLKELNYPIGAVDKVFGPATARAVASFKLDRDRADPAFEPEPKEIVGPATWAALNMGEPVVYANRQDATVHDLKAAGSETAHAASGAQTETALITVAAGAKLAQESGAGDVVAGSFGWVPQMHSSLVPVIDAVGWAVKNLTLVAIIILAALLWRRYGKVLAARLRDYVNGFNLAR